MPSFGNKHWKLRIMGEQFDYGIYPNKMLTFRNKIYVPNQDSIKQLLLDEFHKKPYDAHPRYNKLFSTIKKSYF